MSLMKSLAKVAAGVMVAKGVGSLMKSRQQGSRGGSSASGSGGGLLDSLLGNNVDGQRGGSITDQLGKALGGRSSGGRQGGLGGMLDGLAGRGGSSGGGLGGMLGQLTGGKTGSSSGSGGLGDMLGGLLGGAAVGGAAGATASGLAQKDSQPSNNATFGELFNDSLSRNDEPETAPTPEQNATAGLMLKAMIQAAKSDGRIDDAEKQRLLGHLGDDLDDEERQFIREQMAAPVDASGLAKEVPEGLESQVYLMSLLAIDFDNEEEARYLHALAEAMGLPREAVNQIHDEVGTMRLYS